MSRTNNQHQTVSDDFEEINRGFDEICLGSFSPKSAAMKRLMGLEDTSPAAAQDEQAIGQKCAQLLPQSELPSSEA